VKIQTRLKAAAAPLALSVALFAQPAYAQSVAADAEEDATASADAADIGGAIVVTGSRIRRPNLDSTIPITSIGGDTIIQSGDPNIGDTLNELPQLRSTFAQQNPGLGIGIAGLNLLDLRGLGTQRTLVLVNGRRHVAGDILNNATSPDINTIPSDLIERVDVVTGGNSAVYGSDAIAGVVNFVLKRDFEGLQIRGNFGIPDYGKVDNQYVSAMVGQNFADGRGNITLHGEFSNQDRIFASQVPWLAQNDGLVVTDVDPGGLVNGSDGIPDRTFIRDIRSSTINRYGLIPINQNPLNPTCGLGIGTSAASQVPYSCAFIFTPDSQLVAQTGGRLGSGPNGTFAGGNGQTGREDRLLSVIPSLKRYNTNLLAHYEFSEAAEVFLEAKYARAEVQGSNFGPSFMQGTFGQFDYRERIRLDNPYLTPAQRTQIGSAILASGCNTNLSAGCTNDLTTRTTRAAGPGATIGTGGPLNAADQAAIAAGTYRFVLARNLADIDIRDEIFTRETYRAVVGLRGTFNSDWSYEVSANYGRTEENTVASGFLDRQKFMLAIDSGINPANGRIECRSKFDPTARVAYSAATASRLNDDIAACVPYDPFGAGDNTAAANYARGGYTNEGWAEQFVVSAFVSGDTSDWFELPGGPVSLAIGGEYRREDANYEQSDGIAFTTAVDFGSFEPPASEVKEAFAEIRVPILADMPFFEELTLSGAGRAAKYQGGVGTVFAYNGGVDWAPFEFLKFRANYGRAIRAPNATETFGELVPNFAPNFQDPCRPANIGAGSQFRAANCQADLGTLLPNLNSLGVYSLQVLSGVNPDLAEEKSDSITIGAVFQPAFIPGLNLSVDYYNIKVDGVIAALTAQNIVNSCYDQATLDNPFCALFQRFRGPGTGEFNELPGQVQGNTTVQAPFNYAKRIRSGIDTNISYRANFGTDFSLLADLVYTHNLKISNYTNPSDPDFENRILGELGDPKDEFRMDIDLSYKVFTLGYRMRYIGPMWVNFYEDFNSLQGRAPQDADYSDIQQYPETFYHDIRLQWDLSTGSGKEDNLRLYAGVDNVLDTKPPLGSTATGAGSSIYDVRGRTLFAGFRVRY
jgi:outer membrane receptor protein involved in Fe transport